jgi:hypothetical protein
MTVNLAEGERDILPTARQDSRSGQRVYPRFRDEITLLLEKCLRPLASFLRAEVYWQQPVPATNGTKITKLCRRHNSGLFSHEGEQKPPAPVRIRNGSKITKLCRRHNRGLFGRRRVRNCLPAVGKDTLGAGPIGGTKSGAADRTRPTFAGKRPTVRRGMYIVETKPRKRGAFTAKSTPLPWKPCCRIARLKGAIEKRRGKTGKPSGLKEPQGKTLNLVTLGLRNLHKHTPGSRVD